MPDLADWSNCCHLMGWSGVRCGHYPSDPCQHCGKPYCFRDRAGHEQLCEAGVSDRYEHLATGDPDPYGDTWLDIVAEVTGASRG